MKVNKVTAEKYIWGNNCLSWILNNSEALSIKLELMPKNTKEQLHFHEKANQFFFILKGEATFYNENKIIQLIAKEGIWIERKQKHFIANETDENLEFLVISQPTTKNDRIDL